MNKKRQLFRATIIFAIFFLLGIGLLLFAKGNDNTIKQFKYNEQNGEKENYLQVTDLYGTQENNSLESFFCEEDSFERMQEAYKAFTENSKVTYCEVATQSLFLVGDYAFSKSFVDGGKEAINQNGNGKVVTPVKSKQLGENAAEYYCMNEKMESGKWFSQSDYMWKSKKTIPIILGYNYKKYVQIGDALSFCYLGEDVQNGEVIGFLKKDASICVEGEQVQLKNEILIPSMVVESAQASDELFLKRLYMTKTEGNFLYHNEEEYQAATQYIEDVAGKTGIAYSYVEDFNMIPKEEKYTMSVSTANVLLVGAELLFGCVVIVGLLFSYLLWKQQKNGMLSEKSIYYHVIFMVMGLVLGYEVSYKILLKVIGNETLRLNIMRGRYDVLNLILVMGAIYVIGNFVMHLYMWINKKMIAKKA